MGAYGNLHLHFEIQVNKPCVDHFSHSIGVMISAQLIAALCSTRDQRNPYALKWGWGRGVHICTPLDPPLCRVQIVDTLDLRYLNA